MSYRLKMRPEDFVVEEISDVSLLEEGPYTCFLLEKKETNTLDAVHLIAKYLKTSPENIGFAGTKDKKAITKQVCSVKGDYAKQLDAFHHSFVKTTFMGYIDEPIYLGKLQGNHFKITIRDIEQRPNPMHVFVNFYGKQRFGHNNAEIGKHLVLKDFEHAVLLFMQTNSAYKRQVIEFLEKSPRQYVSAIRKVPLKLLRMFVHAYQSKIWNEMAASIVQEKAIVTNVQIPLIGFDLKKEKFEKYLDELMKREQIKPQDFIIKQIPELSSEGGFRKIFADVKSLEIGDLEPDEAREGKFKVRLAFTLSPGCYATVFIHQLFTKFGECEI